jgi:hypothetical protein
MFEKELLDKEKQLQESFLKYGEMEIKLFKKHLIESEQKQENQELIIVCFVFFLMTKM